MKAKAMMITGVSRGLGRALTDWAVDEGWYVYGCATRASAIETMNVEYQGRGCFEQVDVTDAQAVSAWVDGVFGNDVRPSLVVNNAAVVNRPAPLWEVPVEAFDHVIDVNIKGVQHIIRAVVPHLKELGTGVVVNLSSGWGRGVDAGVAPYCATKWAIEGLTAALAEDLPSGIAAYALNPGVIDTDMLRLCFAEGAASFPNAQTWVKSAGPFITGLSSQQGAVSVSVP